MEDKKYSLVSRRKAIVAGATAMGASALGATALGATPLTKNSSNRLEPASSDANAEILGSARMPVVFLPHGGGPWPFVDMGLPTREVSEMRSYLESLRTLAIVAASRNANPRALVVVSAHWEEAVPTVTTSEHPPMFFDYYGFPPETYRLSWPAPGAPQVAARVQELLSNAGIENAANGERGFDHGAFVPLMLPFPNGEIPTIQLSLRVGLDPSEHLAIGRALQPLRDEGVLIVGSGMSYHNMRGFRDARAAEAAEAFDAWLREATLSEASVRDARLANWTSAPFAREVHPREEHLIPLMVIAGAAGESRASLPYNGTFMGKRLSAFHFV